VGAGDADGTRTACHLLASSDAQRKAHGGGGSIRTKPPRGPEQLVVGHTEKPDSSGPRQYGHGVGVWLVGSIFIGRDNRNRVLKASPPDQVEVGEGQSFVPGGTRLIKDHAFLGP